METFGELINKTKADDYFSGFKQIKMGLDLFVNNPGRPNTPEEQIQKNVSKAFCDSKTNAFLFRRDLVKRLLTLTDKYGQKPEYLMILNAALPTGEPTLVILGCNKDTATGDYYSMLDDYAFAETPGKSAVQQVPSSDFGNPVKPLIFKFL